MQNHSEGGSRATSSFTSSPYSRIKTAQLNCSAYASPSKICARFCCCPLLIPDAFRVSTNLWTYSPPASESLGAAPVFVYFVIKMPIYLPRRSQRRWTSNPYAPKAERRLETQKTTQRGFRLTSVRGFRLTSIRLSSTEPSSSAQMLPPPHTLLPCPRFFTTTAIPRTAQVPRYSQVPSSMASTISFAINLP